MSPGSLLVEVKVMNTRTLSHVADTVSEKVGDAVVVAQDIASNVVGNVAERAPDLTSAVGRGARSSMDTVSDAVTELPGTVSRYATKLAAMTPFLDAPPPARHGQRWLVRASVVTALVGLAWWLTTRRRRSDDTTYGAGIAPHTAPEASDNPERRFASAGR